MFASFIFQLKAKNKARHEVQILEEPVRHRPLNNHDVNVCSRIVFIVVFYYFAFGILN